MKTHIPVASSFVEFHRNWFSGRAVLNTEGGEVLLQSAIHPTTHFSLSLTKSWSVVYQQHTIRIEKTRPLFLAGLRKHQYRFYVNDALVKACAGY